MALYEALAAGVLFRRADYFSRADLAANLAALVLRRVDIEIPVALGEVGGLRVAELSNGLFAASAGTTTPAFCPLGPGSLKCAAVAGPLNPE
jgi:hypothetical protein